MVYFSALSFWHRGGIEFLQGGGYQESTKTDVHLHTMFCHVYLPFVCFSSTRWRHFCLYIIPGTCDANSSWRHFCSCIIPDTYDANLSCRHYCSYIIRGTQFGTCIYMKLTLVRGERGSGSTTKIAELEYDLCSRQWTTMNITWIFHNKYFTVRVINCKFWW